MSHDTILHDIALANRGLIPRLRDVSLHRSLDLAPGHVRLTGNLPVTTIERTLADLGEVVPRRQGRNGRGARREALETWLFDGHRPRNALGGEEEAWVGARLGAWTPATRRSG
jgi:hypothetical protein